MNPYHDELLAKLRHQELIAEARARHAVKAARAKRPALTADSCGAADRDAPDMRPRYFPRWLERAFTSPDGGFGPATPGEPIVYGARRPGFPLPTASPDVVARWIAAVRAAGVRRVVCLLPPRQLAGYGDLLDCYQAAFGAESVCWAPIADFRLADRPTLIGRVLPFLFAADAAGERAVVHCSGGVGRTGHVLAAWLVSARGMSNADAIAAVRRSGRNPRESRDPGLDGLLDACRAAFTRR